jgi:hypothetical protein
MRSRLLSAVAIWLWFIAVEMILDFSSFFRGILAFVKNL